MEKYIKGDIVDYHGIKYVVISAKGNAKKQVHYQLIGVSTLENLLDKTETKDLSSDVLRDNSIFVTVYATNPAIKVILSPELPFRLTKRVVINTQFVRVPDPMTTHVD